MTRDHLTHKSQIKLAAFVLLLVAASLGCRFSPDAVATSEPQGFLPLTAVASITPPPPPRQSCPVASQQPGPPSWQAPTEAARPLLDYLNAGGQPASLAAPGGQELEWARPDLDGDGFVDLAAVIAQENQSITGEGTMLVFQCQGDQYELIFSAASNPELSAPDIISSQDLNHDGQQDLLISRQRCGAHTCSAQVQFLTLRDGQLINRLEGSTDDLPSPAIEVVEVTEGADQIQITATGINSVGAGPFRPHTRVWSWDGEADLYRPTEQFQAQTDFRIHHLHDADRAAAQNDYESAIEGYRRVIESDSLRAWIEPERERQILAGYARYRLLTTTIQAGDRSAAESWYQRIQADTDPTSAGAAYASLAEAFWLTYQQTNNYGQACQSARAYAASHQDDILDPLYFGYANPSYTPEDICPLGRD